MMYIIDDMNRTQIYLTDEQQRLIRQRADDAGISKAEAIRRILDAALGIEDGVDARLRVVADTAGALAHVDDWDDRLAAARAQSAAERLDALGL